MPEIVHAEKEDLRRQLLGRFTPGVARLVVLPGASHNSVSEDPAYLGLLRGDRKTP